MTYLTKAFIGIFILFAFTSTFSAEVVKSGPPHHWGNKPSVKAEERSTGPEAY
ncbi:uncharacterized protein FA14DRAFT_161338 [Meira miltonrushii]|uniref:Uncharacterized protein n=1 Tax=Meira miltonrushii TaxID=1280837 RepID=A0A316VDH5_9BASI|nr:uncharacterized protein FA14DRAFT_161338 [Meira miltonrushii]PWN33535.1 hypothetical protein FA14DRAFT_161338 [Meira miltonrushii]